MKGLKESLLCEAKEYVSIGSAYHLPELVEFAANFNNFNSKNEEDWEEWDDVYVDIRWAMEHKDLLKKFGKVCKDLLDHTSSDSDFLGNFDPDACELQDFETILGASKGDTVLLHTSDGDDGQFCWFIASDKKGKNAIKDFASMVEGTGGWDPQVFTV